MRIEPVEVAGRDVEQVQSLAGALKANERNLMFAFGVSIAKLPNRLSGPEYFTPEH